MLSVQKKILALAKNRPTTLNKSSDFKLSAVIIMACFILYVIPLQMFSVHRRISISNFKKLASKSVRDEYDLAKPSDLSTTPPLDLDATDLGDTLENKPAIQYNDDVYDLQTNSASYPIMPKGFELDMGKNITVLTNRTITIYYWYFGLSKTSVDIFPDTYYSDHPNLKCPQETRCFFTNLAEHLPNADIVVFNFFPLRFPNMPPPKRPDNQLWVFLFDEPPTFNYYTDWRTTLASPQRLRDYGKYFNLTMTYRLDSNVTASYGRILRRKVPDFSRRYDRFSSKTKTAVFMSSHCGDLHSHREQYVRELLKHGIQVEVIGNNNCAFSGLKRSEINEDPACIMRTHWSSRDECNQKIASMYKFYLAFENSLCKDYVTEKFFRAASLDIIPVVLNGADMAKQAPPHSYIDTKDFSSPKLLAQYLLKVASDSKLYNSYFEWKPYYDVIHTYEAHSYVDRLCRLCAYGHKYFSNPQPTVIQDLDGWWTAQGECVEGKSSWSS